MTTDNLGNRLNRIVNVTKQSLFDQGEFAQLTYGAFDIAARSMQELDQEDVEVTFPVGLRPDKQPINSTRVYKKEELLGRYQLLAFNYLAINGLFQICAIVEAMLSDIIREVVANYPQKLSSKRKVTVQTILEATSLEEVHFRATDALLNEVSYKSPREFVEFLESMISVNLLECTAFHHYVEIKASRDIYIHNRGIANDIYVKKSGSHARVNVGIQLPADIQYFMESYEYSLQLAEWLENNLHEHWHSSEFEDKQNAQTSMPLPEGS